MKRMDKEVINIYIHMYIYIYVYMHTHIYNGAILIHKKD